MYYSSLVQVVLGNVDVVGDAVQVLPREELRRCHGLGALAIIGKLFSPVPKGREEIRKYESRAGN